MWHNGTHKYECGVCGHMFYAGEEYEDDPRKRNCPSCNNAKAQIIYHGYCGFVPKHTNDYMGDSVNGLQSMADGKFYDSKSAYRKSLKEKGMVELGSDAPTADKAKAVRAKIDDKDLKSDIKTAIEQLGG